MQTEGIRSGYGRMLYKRFIHNVLFFVITRVYGGIGTCGKHRDRCGDPWEDQEVVLCLLIHLSLQLV